MGSNAWLLTACAAPLAVAAVCHAAAEFAPDRRWSGAGRAARAAGALVLIAILLKMAVPAGWAPHDLCTLILSLALSAVSLSLLLFWRLGAGGEAPALDLAALGLVLLAATRWTPDLAHPCQPLQVVPLVQWALLVLGAGAALVGGCAGLMLFVRAVAGIWRRTARREDEEAAVFLTWTFRLALLGFAGGIAAGAGWAWWTEGVLTNGKPHETWTAVAGLLAAMGLVSSSMLRRAFFWVAWAVLAAVSGTLGFLALSGLG